jgi:polysaccharide biosynthesis/export protein
VNKRQLLLILPLSLYASGQSTLVTPITDPQQTQRAVGSSNSPSDSNDPDQDSSKTPNDADQPSTKDVDSPGLDSTKDPTNPDLDPGEESTDDSNDPDQRSTKNVTRSGNDAADEFPPEKRSMPTPQFGEPPASLRKPDRAGRTAIDAAASRQPRTEFERLVALSVGTPLPVFGSQLFRDAPSTFAPVDRAPVRAEYAIGPGDELLIRIWGSIGLDSKVMVDRNGQVYLPKVGMVNVAGLRYEQLEGYLRSRVGQQFRGFDLSVSLGRLRSIQVFLLGSVRRPGTYTVSSLSTLVDALFVCGGPSPTGSMREIQLKRGDRVVANLDLYDLLVLGNKSKDASLEPGDVIYIPPAGPRVAIAGSVTTPAIFEIGSKTTLGQTLAFGGGLSVVAGANRVIIESISDRKDRAVAEYSLDQALEHRLRDGDIVRVFPVSPRFENAVTLRGTTGQPGRYPWRPGIRITDVLPSREALVTRGYYAKQNALDSNQRRLPGAASAVALSDFRRNSAAVNWDYAIITRMNPADLTTELIAFKLGEAIDHPSSVENRVLQPGDVITIFSQSDLPVSIEKRNRYITIVGEVNAPGVYLEKPGETLRDAIASVGGLTSHSYLFAADMRRVSTREEQEEQLKKLVARLRAEIMVQGAAVDRFASAEDDTARRSGISAQAAYVQRLSEVVPTGRVVLDISPNDNSLSAIPELPLEDSDVIRIPSRGGVVQVIGAVNNESALIYHETFSISDYLGKAGGPTREADLNRSFVIRADGSVIGHYGRQARKFSSMRLMPGDAIVVPDRLTYSSLLHGLRDWSQVFSQFALGVAAAKVLTQ